MRIGYFVKGEDGYVGHLHTLSLNIDLVLVEVEKRESETAPDYRIIAGEDDEVGLLAGVERAGGGVEAEHFGTGEGEGFEGFFGGHAGADADGGVAQEPARVVDGVVGVHGGEDAAFFEFGAVAPLEVAGFEFAAG